MSSPAHDPITAALALAPQAIRDAALEQDSAEHGITDAELDVLEQHLTGYDVLYVGSLHDLANLEEALTQRRRRT